MNRHPITTGDELSAVHRLTLTHTALFAYAECACGEWAQQTHLTTTRDPLGAVLARVRDAHRAHVERALTKGD